MYMYIATLAQLPKARRVVLSVLPDLCDLCQSVAGTSYQHRWLVKEGAEDVHVSKETARAWFRMLN